MTTLQKENHKELMPDTTPKNLSRYQYGDLKYIAHNRVTMNDLRMANMITLTSLAYRGYLRRVGGDSEDAQVYLTPAGEDALATYEQAGLKERMHENDITERCLRLLRHSRRVAVLSKTA